MQIQEKAETTNVQAGVQAKTSNLEVEVERFPVAKPKFSKEAWDSGEGAGEGEG
jgi:hypothetical protein